MCQKKICKSLGAPASQKEGNKDMEENFNKQTKEVIDTTGATDPTVTVKIGHIYPNLYSQASYLKKDVEKIENEIVKTVGHINTAVGSDGVKMIIDSIYHFVDNQITLSKEFEDYFDEQTLQEFSNDVYARAELAKYMLDLTDMSKRLREKKEHIELTKRNVLL